MIKKIALILALVLGLLIPHKSWALSIANGYEPFGFTSSNESKRYPYLDIPAWYAPKKVKNPTFDQKIVDFVALQFLVLGVISYQPQIRNGLFDGPSIGKYADNIKHMKWHDGDRLDAELRHIPAGLGMWAYFRNRGYTKTEAAWGVLGTGLWREWVWKGWGAPQSFDDPLMFTVCGVALGLVTEAAFDIDYTKFNVFPVITGQYNREQGKEETFIFIGVVTYL